MMIDGEMGTKVIDTDHQDEIGIGKGSEIETGMQDRLQRGNVAGLLAGEGVIHGKIDEMSGGRGHRIHEEMRGITGTDLMNGRECRLQYRHQRLAGHRLPMVHQTWVIIIAWD
jgi:hypothetical protein